MTLTNSRPSYEIATETAAPWLLVSSEMRSKLGLKIKEIQAKRLKRLGPRWDGMMSDGQQQNMAPTDL